MIKIDPLSIFTYGPYRCRGARPGGMSAQRVLEDNGEKPLFLSTFLTFIIIFRGMIYAGDCRLRRQKEVACNHEAGGWGGGQSDSCSFCPSVIIQRKKEWSIPLFLQWCFTQTAFILYLMWIFNSLLTGGFLWSPPFIFTFSYILPTGR